MKKKSVLSLFSLFLGFLVVLTSCGGGSTTTPTATGPRTATTAATTTVSTTAPSQTTKPSEKPQYGGTLTYRLASDPPNFDSGAARTGGYLLDTVYQQYVGLDWTRGPAGSGVTNFAAGPGAIEDYYMPLIAESWKLPQQGVWVLQIRKGVHWQKVPSDAGRLMGGREVTADDIVSSFNRLLNVDGKSPNSWIVFGQPAVAKSATIEKTGPWEVTIMTPVDYMTSFTWLIWGAGFNRVFPPEVVAKYGDVRDWRNAVGTGPFMLVDYVPGSQFTYVRNPNYWEKDPIGPGKGNQLPYVEGIKELIIPDLSTTLAALRTGKLDFHTGAVLDDARTLWSTNPGLEYMKYLGVTWGIGMRQDESSLPYKDVKVRQAMMLATDFQAIKKDFFKDEAEIDVWPSSSTLTAVYEPLDKMPEPVRQLYQYNPQKAKQLLADAGYPNGFKASIIVPNFAERVDELSIIQDLWAKVGIELNLDVKEPGAYATYTGANTPYPDMLYANLLTAGLPFTLYQAYTRGAAILNISHVNNPPGSVPFLENLFNQYGESIFVDMPKVYGLVKEHNRYVMEQAYVIPRPTPYNYNFWWPWVNNYYGQGTTGFVRYAWVDGDLKQSLGK